MTSRIYKWWERHRRVVTFGSFLVLFGYYLSPIIEESKYKNACIKLTEKGALYKFNDVNIKEKLFLENGLTIEELAKIEGYKNCVK